MNVKYLLPFVEAAAEVLKAEAQLDVNRGQLSMDKSTYYSEDLTVIISLIGDIVGTVLYSMDSSTAMNISSAILGEKLTELSNLAQSGIAELSNVITGRASVKLSRSGYQSNISPPTLLIGSGGIISTLDLPRLIVPMSGTFGALTVHLALRENLQRSGLTTNQMAVPNAPKLGDAK